MSKKTPFDEPDLPQIGPTFARYSEARLKGMLRSLDPDEPDYESTKAAIEQRLARISGE